MSTAYRSFRSAISALVAYPLLVTQKRRISRGTLLSMPWSYWSYIPKPIKTWVRSRVLKPGEEFAWHELRRHNALSSIIDGEKRNTWAISPSTSLVLWRLLIDRKPKRILEFGSGLSTRIFSEYARQMDLQGQQVSIVSIENDKDWLEQIRSLLVAKEQEQYVNFVYSPVSEQSILGREIKAYSIPENRLSSYAESGGFDLCLIDGPPGKTGRAGSFPLAAPFLADDAIILLDDAYRPAEQSAVNDWLKIWSVNLAKARLLLADRHGVAIMNWRKPA